MNATPSTRELITMELDGATVRGTYHKPTGGMNHKTPIAAKDRVGVFFLNSLSPTRAANGDSAVYWADSFATIGYPSFRFDFPGFGDSDGDHPPRILEFINSGGYGQQASTIIEHMVEQFGLSGAVIVGLCAGAVSAIYAAQATRYCRGLVLMDPYFYLPIERSSKPWSRGWQKVTDRVSRSAFGLLISAVSARLGRAFQTCVGVSLPGNANLSLLRSWKGVISQGLPVLIMTSPGTNARKNEFDYLAYILKLAGSRGRVEIRAIDNTGHSFSSRAGRDGARSTTEGWLDFLFASAVRGADSPAQLPYAHEKVSSSSSTTALQPVLRRGL